MSQELLYQVALTQIPNIGSTQAKILIDYFGDAAAVFKARRKALAAVEGIGEVRAKSIKEFDAFDLAADEIAFIESNNIQPLFITDERYPKRLLHCYDPPTLLYYRGNANLNASRIISIIGTRNNSDYGKQFTEDLINRLAQEQIMVISGLAFGIDIIAHKACLQRQIPTIGVLAHGLDTIYPPQHRTLAREMVQAGGLLTEFCHGVKADKHNFPKRNRIVAGMADATIVVETADKGGSMITAELACNYNRDLFAVPGRTIDPRSSGCLRLIQENKAILLTDANQLLLTMGWQRQEKSKKLTRELFVELTPEEKILVQLLTGKDGLHIDELYQASQLSASSIAAAILNLELQNVLIALPGKCYKLS